MSEGCHVPVYMDIQEAFGTDEKQRKDFIEIFFSFSTS
jgi:hypothetical protein